MIYSLIFFSLYYIKYIFTLFYILIKHDIYSILTYYILFYSILLNQDGHTNNSGIRSESGRFH
jgi:hypothetical protein